MKKKSLYIGIFSVIFIFILIIAVSMFNLAQLPENMIVFSSDIEEIQNSNIFGNLINAKIADTDVVADSSAKSPDTYIDFKLFDLIPIKRQKIQIVADDEVFGGGVPIGLALKANGALVIGSSSIKTNDGIYDIATLGSLKVGDIITKIDGKEVFSTTDISKYLNTKDNPESPIELTYIRDDKENILEITPVKDISTDKYRLGVWVRDDASGIGTLTYVKGDYRFGALGHPLCDADAKSIVSVRSGKVYNCSILGVNKGKAGSPGELRGMFLHGKSEQGYIDKNNEYGIFGELKEDASLLEKLDKIKVGGRYSVKPGKAKIKCCIDGNIKLYDIEIIKSNYKNYNNDKSMVIRVVDKELLAKTGGIVQGMSGSPIIQNGKIVGAVTHVFVNDPTKGFGVYLDFMLNE